MLHGRTLLQAERSEELHDGVEAVVLAGRHDVLLVSADRKHRAEAAGEGSHDLVVKIPGLDAQGLGAVHCIPGGRGLEVGEIQKTFIHDSEGVCHRLPGLFRHLDGEVLLRSDGVGHLDDRLQVRGRILHAEALHAVEAQRQVALGLAERLHEGDVDIEIRGHLRRDGEGVRGILSGVRGYPVARDHAGAVLQRNEGLSAVGGRDVHRSLLAGTVTLLVGGEGEHGDGVGIDAAGTAHVGRPVDDDRLSCDVPARDVTNYHEVAAPFLLGSTYGERGVLGAGSKLAGGDRLGVPAADVALEAVRVALPPPSPVQLVHGVLELAAGEALAGGVDDGDADRMVLVRLQVAVRREFHAHISREGRIRDGLGGEALVTAALHDGGDDEGLQQAGRVLRGRQVEGRLGRAVARKDGLEEPVLAGLEGRGGVAEDISLEARERGRTL